MHDEEEAQKQYISDALECLKIKFVNQIEDISSAQPKYKVEYAYQQFGDSERIFGYKDLQLTLCFTEATMFPHLIVEHSGKFENAYPEPDDVYEAIKSMLNDDQKDLLENRGLFIEKLKKQLNFEPFGTEIPSFINEKETGRKFALFRLDGELTEEQKVYLERIQSILYFYIEGVKLTDSDDDRFSYYVLFEVFESDAKSGRQYRVAAYGSYYKYYCHPFLWRLRAAHTFVFPQFRGMGMGAKFLHAVNMDIKKHDNIYDAVMETPAPELVMARDVASILELIQMDEFSKEKILEPLTKAKKEAARKEWKMYKGEVSRAYEIIKYAVSQKKGKDAVAAFREEILKRVRKPSEDKKKVYQRMMATLPPEEVDMVIANDAEVSSETQHNKFVDRLFEEYQIVIDRLTKHSEAFRNYF